MAKSANPFAVFRKHQKALLAVAGVLLMLVFVIGQPLMQWFGGSGRGTDRVVVRWDGREVRESRLGGLVQERQRLADFFRACQTLAVMRDRNVQLPQPIIAAKEQVTEGETGFIATDTIDFAAKLNLLIQHEALRAKMGQNARDYALTQNWDAVFETLFDDYQRIADKGNPAAKIQ